MPAPTQPIDLMFNAYRGKALAVLLLRPDEEFHVRVAFFWQSLVV
jgi:hypothetical protein